jgi:hypothetical protein
MEVRHFKFAFVASLAALPFALCLGALATKVPALVALHLGSEWFTFKSAVGIAEIVVFGVAASISKERHRGKS